MNNLNGEWKVKVVEGPLWFRCLNILRDKKVIEGDKGYNVICGKRWGEFEVMKCDAGTFLFYNNNSILDIVKFIDKNKIAGKFYYKWGYIGDFTMIRIKKEKS